MTAAAWGRTEQQDYRGRVRGSLLGAALGDALGAPVASLTLDKIHAEHGSDGITQLVPFQGRRGTITAGTQLALFTVDGLVRAHVRRDTGAWHPPTDLHRAYRRWMATQLEWGPDERREEDGWLAREEWLYARRSPSVAALTGLAHERPGTMKDPKNAQERGVEAAVRCAPIGLLVGWEPELVMQLAVECAVQTHGHPTAYLTAGAHAVLIHAMVRGDTADTAVQKALKLLAPRPGHRPVTAALQQALGAVRQGMPSASKVEHLASDGTAEGAADGALAAAVYATLVGDGIRHGLCLAVNQGAVDSALCGALAGALLGALHGETGLPPGWVADLEGRATVLELADDFAMEMTQGPALHSPGRSSPGWLARYPRA